MNIIKNLLLLTLLLSGCSSAPEKPEQPPTIVNTKITVSLQANPDIDNRASPIAIRIFELKSLGKYSESDFYGLYDNYESVLGSDLLASEQFNLNPGDIHNLKQTTSTGTQYIAVIAAFRDLNKAIWRDHIILPVGKETQIMVAVEKLAISVWKK